MAREIVIGIDPGSKGFMAMCAKGTWSWVPLDDVTAVLAVLRGVQGSDVVVCIEKVGAIHGTSSTSTFKFGFNVGFIEGLVSTFGLPLTHVTPQVWQREMCESGDKVLTAGKVNTKRTSQNAAKRLFPKFDFRRTVRSEKDDDNKVDATLICAYALRKNL